MASARVDEIIEKIRESGGRVTQSRRMVVEQIVDRGHHHVTAPELIEVLRQRDPEFHESTVYRVLERLTDIAVVEPVQVSSGPVVYHLAHDGHVHHHLLCTRCGSVTETRGALLQDVAAEVRERYGFAMKVDSPATLSGLCAGCRSAADR